MAVDHLTIDDMSDREFLLVLDDLSDGDGWADAKAIQQRLDATKVQSVASRLSWLTRWGVVEREHLRDEAGNLRYTRDGQERYTQRWRMTVAGAAMAFGTLRQNQLRTLDGMDDTTLLELTAYVTTRARGIGDVGRKLVAREWRYGASAARGTRVA